jgi:nicotinate phosphoribosyltransferase
MDHLINFKNARDFKIHPKRIFHSATHEEIQEGMTTDIYFLRTRELLSAAKKQNTQVTAEIFTSRPGILAGIEEALGLLKTRRVSVWAIPEKEEIAAKEVVMRIRGSYDEFGIFETALLGMLASASGWATATRTCVEAAAGKAIYCFGARHLHPAVAPVMERASLLGGAAGCSCILGAKLCKKEPSGTVPHAAILIIGDTVETARLYDCVMPEMAARIILVDTFKDEAEEALRVAECLKERLQGVRLDTPGERGGVTPGLVREVRARLDQKGFSKVKIFVSGGLTPERIKELAEAGADAFGVGSYIARADAIDMTMDIKEIEGKALAKRGRIPGITKNPRLKQFLKA